MRDADQDNLEEDERTALMTTTAASGADGNTTIQGAQPNRSDIAAAVAARLQKGDFFGQGGADNDYEAERTRLQSAHLQKVRRLINEISGSVSYERVFGCLQLVHTLLNNIVAHEHDDKYRSFRAAQPKIARDVLAIPHAVDLLILAGFRTRTTSFQQEWFVPDGAAWPTGSVGMLRLAWTCNVVAERMEEFADNAERARLRTLQEKEFQASRKARALAEAQEDRERVAMRSRREKDARAAAARAQQQRDEEDAAAAAASAQ